MTLASIMTTNAGLTYCNDLGTATAVQEILTDCLQNPSQYFLMIIFQA